MREAEAKHIKIQASITAADTNGSQIQLPPHPTAVETAHRCTAWIERLYIGLPATSPRRQSQTARMNVDEAVAFARQDAANASDAYEAAAHARAAVAAMPDKRALRHARAACAAALGPLRSVAAWDAATYWDNVPEGFQAAHAAAAVLWAALDDCAGARLHVDVATICASSARCSGPARARRLAALRSVRGAGGSSVAHVAPWSHASDVVRPPQKKRRVVEPLVDSMEVVAARAFRPGLAPKRICDALAIARCGPPSLP